MTSSDWWSRSCQTTSNWLLLKPLILYSPLSQWYYSSHCYFKCHVVLDIFNSWVVFSLVLSWRWLVCMEGVSTLYCIGLWKWYQDDETLLYKSITWKWWKNLWRTLLQERVLYGTLSWYARLWSENVTLHRILMLKVKARARHAFTLKQKNLC